jgi:hypothetical protein
MHSCGLLTKGDWKNRMVIYRSSNVEHDYYQALASKELNSIKKLFFNIEAWKLKRWEKNLAKTDLMLTVSEMDEAYYKNRFPKNKIENIYSFFDQEESNRNYDQVIDDRIILYHGNLSVQENIHTANYIIDELSRDVHFPFVIAGKNPSEALLQKATKVRNVEIIANPDDVAMKKLLSTAQIHLLLTDQTTGLKLKLLYSIFEGKHCLVNDKMLAGTNLEACTHIANSKEEIVVAIYKLMGIPFDNHAFEERKTQIPIDYINEEKVKKLVKLVWG